jgi:hypothetical protein
VALDHAEGIDQGTGEGDLYFIDISGPLRNDKVGPENPESSGGTSFKTSVEAMELISKRERYSTIIAGDRRSSCVTR